MTNIKVLIETYPLYKKLEIDLDQINPLSLSKLTYNSYCNKCKSHQTFELTIYLNKDEKFKRNLNQIAEGNYSLIIDKTHNDIIDDSKLYYGTCKHCNKYKQSYLLNIKADKPQIKSNREDSVKPKYYISKTGQFPPYQIIPEKGISDFLSSEDLEYYKKALMNLSSNYGIGAFAYFRRIIENQIKSICIRLSKMDFEGALSIREALEKYESNHQMSNLIDEVFRYVPDGLKSLGENPLQLIYDELSGGIHLYTDDECYEKAMSIDKLLKFIIKEISEESRNRKEIIKAIKVLKQKADNMR